MLSLKRWEHFEKHASNPNRLEHTKLELKEDLKKKIKKYHEALLLQSQISNLDRPSSRLLGIIRNYFNKPQPIVYEKAQHIFDNEHQSDLAALHPSLKSDPLSAFLRSHWPWRGNPYPDLGDYMQHILDSQVGRAVSVINTLFAAVLLIGAITSLYFVKKPEAKLGMIAGFTTLSAATVGVMTSAERQEVFAASAAYAAVLVVFVRGDFDA